MAAHTIGRHTSVAEIQLVPVRCTAMACIAFTRRRQHRRNVVRALAGSNCTIVTTAATTLHLSMINVIHTPTDGVAMTRFTLVCACDVRAAFPGRLDAVMTANAISRHTDMIKAARDDKADARRIVASIASCTRRNMARPLTHCDRAVMATRTFRRSAFEHATHVTRFTGNGLMGAK